MSVANPVIDHLDLSTKFIYLVAGCREYHPVDDIYREVRNLRRLNESLRVFSMPVKAYGAVPKGGGKFTPRYAVFNHGWKIVPEDVSHSLYISGEQLTDAGESGPACLDLTVLSAGTNVIIHYEPPAAEIIRDEASLAAIGRMEFNERVTIDVINGRSGTDNRTGTAAFPSDNIVDAVAIAMRESFANLYIIGNLSLVSGDVVDGYTLIGQNTAKTTLIIDSLSATVGCEFKNMNLFGDIDGTTIIRDCIVNTISGVSGFVYNSALAIGTTTIAGEMHFLGCKSIVAGVGTHYIDCGGSGNDISMRGYDGGITIINKNGAVDQVSIDLASGHVKLEATVTEGEVVVRGSGKITELQGVNVILDKTGLLQPDNIAAAMMGETIGANMVHGTVGAAFAAGLYNDRMYIDIVNGEAGRVVDIGTIDHPSNNLEDAMWMMHELGLSEIHLHSNLTVEATEEIAHHAISGHEGSQTLLTLTAGCDTTNAKVTGVAVTGVQGGKIHFEQAQLIDLSNISGPIYDCVFNNSLSFADGAIIKVTKCRSKSQAYINFSINQATINMIEWFGMLNILDKTGTEECDIHMSAGFVIVDSSCISGSIVIMGRGYVIDNSGPGCTVDTSHLDNAEFIAESVWNSLLTGSTYNLPTSAGRMLRSLSSQTIFEENVVSATTNTVTLSTDASDVDGAYDPAMISITEGTGAGQTRLILQYDGATRTAAIDRDWKVPPDDTSTFLISAHPGREHVNEGLAQDGTINTITLNVNASSHDEAYTGQTIFLRSGTGQDQACKITSYDGTTKIATTCKNFTMIPDVTTGYVILPSGYLNVEQFINNMIDGGIATEASLQVNVVISNYLSKIVNNKREVKLNGTTWELIVYDDDDLTPILTKALKDVQGNDISSLVSGAMALEEATSV